MTPASWPVLVLVGAVSAGCIAPHELSVEQTTQAVTDPFPQAAGRYPLRFDVSNGDQRAYILRLPAGYNPARPQPYPLVVMFHGGGQSAQQFANRPGMQRMAALADLQGKILVFAQGTLGATVTAAGMWDSTGAIRDDLLYAEELIAHITSSPDINADPARVLAAGFSMGGHFVHALGADTPTTFVAIGVVSGFYGSTIAEPPPPPAGTLLPVFIVHGDADNTVPIAGGDPVAGGGFRLSALDSYDRWYANDACTLPTAVPLFPPATYTYRFSDCRTGSTVSKVHFTTVFGLRHFWPIAADGYDASARLLAFFDAQ
jgi:polyhydroxybutyrate depolymerase